MPNIVRRAKSNDKHRVLELLSDAELPREGLFEKAAVVLVVEVQGVVSACAAIEVDGRDGLLRSLAVSPDHQGKGIGRSLVDEIENTGLEEGLTHLYLLTTTAKDYFKRLQYEVVDRDSIVDVVRNSDEYSFCSSVGATAMCKRIHQPMSSQA